MMHDNSDFYSKENLSTIDRDLNFYQLLPWPTIVKISKENEKIMSLTKQLVILAREYKKTVSSFDYWKSNRPMGGGSEDIQGWHEQMKSCDQERRDAHDMLIDKYNELIELTNKIPELGIKRTLEKNQQDRANIAKWVEKI